MKKTFIIPLTLLIFAFVGCTDPEPEPENPAIQEDAVAWVLNEGAWGMNNASIGRLDKSTGALENGYFAKINGRGLGDVAQDMIAYGGKLYVSVFESNTIEVIDRNTCKSIKQISMGNRGPRYLASNSGKVYVSCYDKSIARIDTMSLEIDGSCNLSGLQPEGICIVDGMLYACNAWESGDNYSYLYDSTLSVVDLQSLSETGKIVVGVNPSKIKVLDNHRLVVAYSGDYVTAMGGTALVDLNGNSITQVGIEASAIDVYQGNIYLYSTAYDENWNSTYAFWKVNANTLETTPILTPYTGLFNSSYYPYSIAVDPANGNLFVTAASYNSNGDLYCFDKNGQKLWQSETSTFPNKVVF